MLYNSVVPIQNQKIIFKKYYESENLSLDSGKAFKMYHRQNLMIKKH